MLMSVKCCQLSHCDGCGTREACICATFRGAGFTRSATLCKPCCLKLAAELTAAAAPIMAP